LCRGAEDEPKKAEPTKVARQQLKPERLISETAFLYVATPDVRKARGAFERSALRGLLKEDEVARPLLKTYASLRDAYVKGDGTRTDLELRRRNDEADLLTRLAPLLEGQVAIAIEGDAASIEQLSAGVPPTFLLVASIPSGEEGDRRQRELEQAMERHRSSQGVDARFIDKDERVGTYDVVRIENSELKLNESWAFVENLFLYGQGKRVVEDAIERYLKNSAGTLSRNSGYQGAYDLAGRDERSDALIYAQIDLRPVVAALTGSYPALKYAINPKVLEAGQPYLAMGVFVGDGDNAPVRERIFVRSAPEAAKKTEACTASTSRFASSDVVFFSATQWTMADLYNVVVEGIKRGAPPADGKDTPLQERLKGALKLQNNSEITAKLESLKGEIGLFMSYVPSPALRMDRLSDYMEVLQPVLALELDGEAAEGAVKLMLDNIKKETGQEYTQITVGPTTVFYQKGPASAQERTNVPGGFFAPLLAGDGGKFPFFNAYAIASLELEAGRQRKFLLLSDSLAALKKAVQQAQPQYAKSCLAEDPKFKEIARRFRESRWNVSYLDLPKLLDAYGTELPRLARTDIFGGGDSKRGDQTLLDTLPSPNVLRDHLFPMSWAASNVPEPAGTLIESVSPLGNLPLVGLVGSVAWPAVVAQRQKAISDKVDENFKHIMLALQLYASDFDRYPPQLSEIYNYAKKDLSIFESPFRRGAIKSPQDIDDPKLTNLIYVPSHSVQDLGSDILLYEKEPTRLHKDPSDGTFKLLYHVLTVQSGKRTMMTKNALDRALAGKAEVKTNNTDEATKAGTQPRK
jgi:hypothetical protein